MSTRAVKLDLLLEMSARIESSEAISRVASSYGQYYSSERATEGNIKVYTVARVTRVTGNDSVFKDLIVFL